MESDVASDEATEELRLLLEEADRAWHQEGASWSTRWSAVLAVFRGRWRVVLRAIFGDWSAGRTHELQDSIDPVVEAALEDERARLDTPPSATGIETSDESPPTQPNQVTTRPDVADQTSPPPDQATTQRVTEDQHRDRDLAFLRNVEARRGSEEKDLKARVSRLERYQGHVYKMLLLAAAIALGIATVGALMIFRDHPAAGAIVTAAALVPGSGAAILFKLSRTLQDDKATLQRAREKSRDDLESIQAILVVNDPTERDRMVGEYASDLRARSRPPAR
jgi:hypothetical protein